MIETNGGYAAENGIVLIKGREGLVPYFPAKGILKWMRENNLDGPADALAAKIIDAKIEYVDFKGV